MVNFHKKVIVFKEIGAQEPQKISLFQNLRESLIILKFSREYKFSVGGKLNQEHYLKFHDSQT